MPHSDLQLFGWRRQHRHRHHIVIVKLRHAVGHDKLVGAKGAPGADWGRLKGPPDDINHSLTRYPCLYRGIESCPITTHSGSTRIRPKVLYGDTLESSPVVRDPCASERKIGVMSGDWRIARTTISLGLFKLVLLRIFVRGLPLG